MSSFPLDEANIALQNPSAGTEGPLEAGKCQGKEKNEKTLEGKRQNWVEENIPPPNKCLVTGLRALYSSRWRGEFI